MTRLPVYAIAAVVLLRLLCGWHFFNEGVKKLDPDFSSAGFLRTASGPLAPAFKAMVPGPHNAFAILTKPVEVGTRSAEEQRKLEDWMNSYRGRALNAAADGEPMPRDIDPVVPGAPWVDEIEEDWNRGLKRLGRLGADGEIGERLAALRDEKLGDIVNYLHSVNPDIQDAQHEAWLLQELRKKVGDSPAPFQRDLISDQETDVWKSIQPWVRSVQLIEQSFVDEAGQIVADAGISPGRVASALEERRLLGWIDFAVKCVVLGCGICLFLGLATPVAALLAAGFLLSLILTQPPWVVGADLSAFFTWAIELAALLVLAAVGAGRWAGLDGVMYLARRRFGDLSPKYQYEPGPHPTSKLPQRPQLRKIAE